MRTNYPTEKRYSLQRHLTDVLDHGSAELYEADESLRIRDQWKAMGKASPDGAAEVRATSDPRSIRPSIRGEQTRTTFLPYSAFGKIQTRSDLIDISGITNRYSTGLIAHAGVLKADASVWENLEGQVCIAGTTQIPQPSFASAGGTQQSLASSTLTAFSTSVTVSFTSTLGVGMSVSAANPGYLSPDTLIQQIVNSTTLTLNQPALQGGTVTLNFWSVSDGTSQMTSSPRIFLAGTVGGNPMFFSPLRLCFKVGVSNQLLHHYLPFPIMSCTGTPG
jgi:hypothetical protein